MTVWLCAVCGRQTEAPSAPWWCACGSTACFVRASRRPVGEVLAAAARPRSAAEVCRQAFDMRLCKATGLSFCFPAVFCLFGPPGAGKTAGALQIAGAMGEPVTVGAYETLAGPTLAYLLRAAGLQNRRDVTIYPSPAVGELVSAAGRHEVIVLDSLSVTTIQPADVRGLCLAGSPAVICVLHVRKDGRHAGGMTILHEADLVLELSPGGAWECLKSRFGPTGETGTFRGVTHDETEAIT